MHLNALVDHFREINTSPVDHDTFQEWIGQKSFLYFLKQTLHGQYITLYASGGHSLIQSLVIPREKFNSIDTNNLVNWDLSGGSAWSINYTYPDPKSDKLPKVWLEEQGVGNSEELREAERFIFTRNFEGKIEGKSYFEVPQKFTHPHNLHYVEERKAYCRFDESGDIEDIIKCIQFSEEHLPFGGKIIAINREILEELLVLTNSVFIRVFDSTRFNKNSFQGWGKYTNSENITNPYLKYKKGHQDGYASFIRGFDALDVYENRDSIIKRIVGLDKIKEYATFIAQDWKNNVIKECSCDPEMLASYFEKESPLPFQITPAFFKPEVLTKYKNDPNKYTLENRSITCREAWHLETYDINDAGQVHTYLRYLSYLPYSEQLHWKQYNERPKSPISKRAFKTDFDGDWDTSYEPLQSLKSILNQLIEQKCSWWEITDKKLLEQVHYVHTDSIKEWGDELLALHQLVVEGFNRKHLKQLLESTGKEIPKGENWGTITLLEKIFLARHMQEDEFIIYIKPLRELNTLRTKMRGHREGSEAVAIRNQLIKEHGSLKAHFYVLVQSNDETMRWLTEQNLQPVVLTKHLDNEAESHSIGDD